MSSVVPIVNQNRTISQIKAATRKFLKVWSRVPPKANFEHEEVETRILQLPDSPTGNINLRHEKRQKGDPDAPNPDDKVYYITERQVFTMFGQKIHTEIVIKGFLFEKSQQDASGNIVQSAREDDI